ncbi:L,D-transpeptidase family protein [Bosea sp. 117]|uniref:L,D-transpeptidase family protein n=1 Tax=Bosea sp. 117 TaxID=1125973 RepID=UPI00068C3A45|nr:L,D-transpeptidase family protein [Bosea sp. 117]
MSRRFDYLAGTALAAFLALGLAMPLAARTQPEADVETTDNAGMGTDDLTPAAGTPADPTHAAQPAAPDGASATPLPDATPEAAKAAIPDAMEPSRDSKPAAVAMPEDPPAPPAAPEAPDAVTAAPLPEVAPAAPSEPAVAAPAPEAAPAIPNPPATAAAPEPVAPAPEAPAQNAASPQPAAPAVAATPEAPAADPVSEALAALLAGLDLGKFVAQKPEQEALVAFYAGRGGKPAFLSGRELSPLSVAVRAQFAASGEDGLSPSDYAVAAPSTGASDVTLAETELRMAAATLTYARHLQSGRFDPSRISAGVTPLRTPPDPAKVLQDVSGAADPRAVLTSYAPQYEGYGRLKAKLAELRAEVGSVPPPQVPQGRVLRPNMDDPRVPLLRTRLGVQGDVDSMTYDHDLVEAVKQFQEKLDQPANGIIGKATIAALNDTGEARISDIVANMERWRWLPHDVAPSYVMVNIPEFMVRIVRDGKLFHETKVVVGKPENQTPLLTHDMEYVVFNPAWNVPPGIARKEMLPKLASDPYALSRQGIDVVRNGRVVDPGSIDWSRGTQGYSFRQPPGERNALGNIKFMFPNKHSVYLHDTPSRSLFANARRAYSHGCVRVFEPLKFGEAIFALGMPTDTWSQQRIAKMKGGSEKYVNLKQRFPVHLVYFTSFVDDEGRLVSREDLYGINAQTKLMLGLDGARRVADRGVVPAAR